MRPFVIFVVSALLAALLVVCNCSQCQARELSVSVAVETPVGGAPDRPQDDTPALLLDLKLPELFGPVTLFASGEYPFQRGEVYRGEDQFKVGLSAPIGVEGLSVYSYWERRTSRNANRFMVGVKYGFTVGY